MNYQVEYTPQAVEDLKGLRPMVRGLLYGWIEKNLVDCEDPRRYGSGDPDGGRWRYPIGEYRLLAEIQEDRIIILAVVSGLRRTGSRKNGGANKLSAPSNVFLRSTLRQPVRTILLLLITALLTFAFVSKGAEYLLIKQETEELVGYYRSIGVLTTGVNAEYDLKADAAGAARYLEANPYVEVTERVQSLSAVTDVYNADTETLNTAYMAADIYFYGTFLSSRPYEIDSDNGSQNYYEFTFQIDSFLTGYPENLRYVKEGDYLTLSSPGGYVGWGRVRNETRTEVRDEKGLLMGWIVNGDPEFEGEPYADLTDLTGELEQGGRYLIRAVNETAFNPYNSINTGEDGDTVFTIAPLTEDGLWCYPVAEGEADFGDPALAGVAEAIRRVDDNQHALLLFGAEDVSALPGLQKEKAGSVESAFSESVLTEGRWPNAQDNRLGNLVCAVHGKLAQARGLSVGDTITVTYRELLGPSDALYPYQPVPYLYQPEDLEREETPTSEAMTFEIVGIYETQTSNEYIYNYLLNYVFVPKSTMPQSMLNASDAVSPYYFSIVLTSPEVEDQFIVETRDALSALGFQARFLPTNYDAFQAAAKPMRQSALYNTIIFSAVLAAALCLAVFLYFRMRRKDLAIARALGVPVGQCVRQVSAPLLLLGLVGILAGGCSGWRYTLENAGNTLSALSELMEESGTAMAALSIGWLALLLAACFVLLLVLTLGGAALMANKPVLDQIQGRTAVKEKRAAAQAEGDAAPVVSDLSAVPAATIAFDLSAVRTISTAPVSGKGMGPAMTLRFVWRHITRARLKTALSVLLAAVFTVALAAIRISIADNEGKIDQLYNETVVEADLLYAHSGYERLGSGYIQDNTLQAILDTGYVLSASPEGVRRAILVLPNPVTEEEITTFWSIRSFEDEDEFLSSSGGGVTVTYFDGWDGSLFAENWEELEGPIPAVLPLERYEKYQLQPGDTFSIGLEFVQTYVAAGYYEGSFADMDTRANMSTLLPRSAFQTILNNGNSPPDAGPESVLDVVVTLTVPSTQEDVVTWYIRSFEHEDAFLSDSGGGSGVTITYFDGWDGSLFAENWEELEGPIPAVLPLDLYEEYLLQPGDTFDISCGRAGTFVAAGYYEGDVADMDDDTNTPVLIPLSAHRLLLRNLGLVYARARLTLDPSINRQLAAVEAVIREAADQKGVIKLETVIWDQELNLAVAPLENNVELMRVLYPVILGLSLLVAAGIAALFIMTSAKEAAILRILGTTKLHSRVMLSLQQVFTSTAGLAVGMLAAVIWILQAESERLTQLAGASALCAALYLLAAVIGAAASSAAATSKNPLELLQVKE